jgi:MFS family permease
MNRRLAVFLSARSLSIFGDRVSDVALPLVILADTGSAAQAGLVGAAVQAPQVLAALHIGALADRRERRGLMVAADLLRAVAFAAIAAVIIRGDPNPLVLVALALVTGVGDALFNAAAGSYLPAIAGDDGLMRANGLTEAADAAATLTGPALGGWMIQRLHPAFPFVVNVGSFLASSALLARLPRKELPDVEKLSLTAGVRLLFSDRRQRALLSGAGYLHLLAAASFLPFLSRAQQDLGLRAGTIGLIVSAAGVGGLISGLGVSRFIGSRHWPLTLATALAVNGLAVGLIGIFERPWLLAVTVLVMDGASALAFIVAATTRQQITANDVRGRVIAASTALTALVRMLAVATVGVLSDLFGPAAVLIALAILGIPFVLGLIIMSAPGEDSPLGGEGGTAPVDGQQQGCRSEWIDLLKRNN